MILSNVAIQAALDEGRIVIVPPPEPRRAEPGGLCPFNTTSVDLRLGHEFVVPEPNRPFAVDLTVGRFSDLVTAENYRRIDCRDGRPYELKPREFVLAQTMETVALPIVAGRPSLAARVEGRSSFARCGMLVHFTAPTIHAGYRGTITLEMTNLGPTSILLRPGVYVCQLIFEEVLGTPFESPSQFHGQESLGGKSGRGKPRRGRRP